MASLLFPKFLHSALLWEGPSSLRLQGLPALLSEEAENGLASPQVVLQSHMLMTGGVTEQRQAGNDPEDQDFGHSVPGKCPGLCTPVSLLVKRRAALTFKVLFKMKTHHCLAPSGNCLETIFPIKDSQIDNV